MGRRVQALRGGRVPRKAARIMAREWEPANANAPVDPWQEVLNLFDPGRVDPWDAVLQVFGPAPELVDEWSNWTTIRNGSGGVVHIGVGGKIGKGIYVSGAGGGGNASVTASGGICTPVGKTSISISGGGGGGAHTNHRH